MRLNTLIVPWCGGPAACLHCSALQEASGIYAHMRENECSKLDSPRPMDLSAEIVLLLEKLMLTQAQVGVGVGEWGKDRVGGQGGEADAHAGTGRCGEGEGAWRGGQTR